MCWQRGYTMEQALYGIYTNVDFSVVCGQKDGSNELRSPLTPDTALVQLTELTKAATTTFSTEFSASLHRRFFFFYGTQSICASQNGPKWTGKIKTFILKCAESVTCLLRWPRSEMQKFYKLTKYFPKTKLQKTNQIEI